MKGKAMIQLFDAKSGDEVQRIEDNNLVTNAVKDFLEHRMKEMNSWIMYDYNKLRGNAFMYPIINDLHLLYKGLVLFGETLTSDADAYFLDKNPTLIGYAGGDYALSNPLRGDWNDTESGLDLENKKMTLVWDFDTDKGNGEINCACLCPKFAGEAGWGTDNAYFVSDATQTAMVEHGIYFSNSKPHDVDAKSEDMMPGIGDDDADIIGFLGDYVYYQKSRSYNAEVCKVRLQKPGALINPFDIPDLAPETIGNYAAESTSYYPFFFMYNGQMHVLESNGTTNDNKLYTVDTSDLSKTLVCTVDTALDVERADHAHFIIIDGFLYLLSDDKTKIYKVNASTGAYIGDIATPNTGVDYIREWNGMLMAGDNSGTDSAWYAGKFWTYDGTSWSKEKRGAYCAGNYTTFFKDVNNYPFLVLGKHTSSLNYLYFMHDLCFLTTINNLATPVTKNDTQTMKVTYTLSW